MVPKWSTEYNCGVFSGNTEHFWESIHKSMLCFSVTPLHVVAGELSEADFCGGCKYKLDESIQRHVLLLTESKLDDKY